MTSIKNTLLGCGVVLLSNSCLLSTSYLAKYKPVSSGEIMAMGSLLQVIVFGVWGTFQGIRVQKSPPLKHTRSTWVVVGLTNLLLAAMNIICYIAVKMLPLSDFIVLVFTSPVFTLAASFVILR